LSDEALAQFSVWSELQMICIWSSWWHCHLIVYCCIKIQTGSVADLPRLEAIKWVSDFILLSLSLMLLTITSELKMSKKK